MTRAAGRGARVRWERSQYGTWHVARCAGHLLRVTALERDCHVAAVERGRWHHRATYASERAAKAACVAMARALAKAGR